MNEELVFNPTRLDISRSVFPVKRNDKGTGFVGHLNAVRPFEVLPGDGWDLSASMLIRFTTPVHPVMDNLFCDVFAFFCSDEMLLKRQSFSPNLNDGNHSFAAIMGAQDGLLNMPYPDAGLQIPKLKYFMAYYDSAEDSRIASARLFVLQNSLLDQLGYPLLQDFVGDDDFDDLTVTYSSLPLLAYVSIWNENFREPNLQNRYTLSIISGSVSLSSDYTCCLIASSNNDPSLSYGDFGEPLYFNSDICTDAQPLGVCRFHGLYGSLLPFPQRNSEPVFLPLGELAPVVSAPSASDGSDLHPMKYGIKFGTMSGSDPDYFSSSYDLGVYSASGNTDGQIRTGTGTTLISGFPITSSNLVADLSQATSASINTIRVAFQTQKWFEALARGGNGDLDEYISSIFGVVGREDVESKRPLYLGGSRFPISISQVNNTATDTGETGAFSLTTHDDHYVRYQSKTYGQIMFVFCIRHEDSFCDVPDRFLKRFSKFDFYAPQFANLGEEVYDRSLVVPESDVGEFDKHPFGYQEYGADYRYDVNRFGGQLRFTGDNSWHFATLFDGNNPPDLAGWLDASSQILDIDRTLKVSGAKGYMQFMYDFYVYGKKYRPLPVNSIPGLVDHH